MFEKEMLPFVISATLMTTIAIFFLAVFLITIKNRQNSKVKALYEALINEKESTMRTISAELHDNIVQMLHIASMNLQAAKKEAAATTAERLSYIDEIMHHLLLDVHNISYSLNTDLIKKRGLLMTLEQELEWVNASKKLKGSLEISGVKTALDPQQELMIIRIAQEAVNNVIKYAGATILTIRITYTRQTIEMAITDNGAGFNPRTAQEGIGIQSMRQRAFILNGTLQISSEEGAGTTVVLTVPAHRKTGYPKPELTI